MPWIKDYHLYIAPAKSDAITLKDMYFRIGNASMQPSKTIKYLRVIFLLDFGNYVVMVAHKTEEKSSKNAQIVPNAKGPSTAKQSYVGHPYDIQLNF